MAKLAAKLVALTLLSASCDDACYPELDYSNFTSYPTPRDPPSERDQEFLRAVSACLDPIRAVPLSSEEAAAAECDGQPVLELRSCIRVAVPPDWHWNCSGTDQVFPCSVGDQRCLEKGLHPTPECPCSCRAQIQDRTTIWTTPNRRLLAAYLVTMLTGCLSPWTPRFSPCSSMVP